MRAEAVRGGRDGGRKHSGYSNVTHAHSRGIDLGQEQGRRSVQDLRGGSNWRGSWRTGSGRNHRR
jgi:hypothetical protein